jgi:hypothetical protein
MDTGRTCVGYDWVNNAIGALLGTLAATLLTRVIDLQRA